MLIFLHCLALLSLAMAQRDCSRGACYPATGDLLVGRISSLKASSTCGLTGPEVLCSALGQRQIKCCTCDSRQPKSQMAHRIENVAPQEGPYRWWQAQKGVENVTVQLDLDRKFQLGDIVLDFKGPRPEAFVIERSTDYGKTWQPYLYLATDCHSSFPGISTKAPSNLQESYCHSLPPIDYYKNVDQKLQFNPLNTYQRVNSPQSYKIDNVADFTNLRMKFTKLAQPRQSENGRGPHAFYGLKEMRIQGSCFCHGHASQCVPSDGTNELSRAEVYSTCVCQHNTAGPNCERCADFYNDHPWRPADESNTNQCQRCDCNNHSERCHFDPAVFEASGMVSGGVCDNCQHYTTGRKCEKCRQFYYRNPLRHITHPEACLRCNCSTNGAEQQGLCNAESGYCMCKANVEGPGCDRCKLGFYGLSASDPKGCKKCSCSLIGSQRDRSCDPLSGQCFCLPNVIGQNCDLCATNYWNFLSGRGCEPCNCDPRNSLNQQCNQLTGQCQCRPGFGGRTCSGCADGTYGNLQLQCRPCNCDSTGTLPGICDKTTGACLCRPGVIGPRCDQCQRGTCNRYPDCQQCHPCFQDLDSKLQGYATLQSGLSRKINIQVGGGDGQVWDPRITGLDMNLKRIREGILYPKTTDSEINNARFSLQANRDSASRIGSNQPTIVDQSTSLTGDLDDLNSRLNSLRGIYITRWDFFQKFYSNIDGSLSTIRSAYDQSGDAMKKVANAEEIVKRSLIIQKRAEDMEGKDQEKNRQDLEHLSRQVQNQPDLTPTAGKVCGSYRTEPCTPEQCDGALCPGPNAVPCSTTVDCRGALPLGKKAESMADTTKAKLNDLNAQIRQATRKIQDTVNEANGMKQTFDQLANQVSTTRPKLEKEIQNTRQFIKQVREFLSAPDMDPAVIQLVSEQVLNMKLPGSIGEIRDKVDQIKAIAGSLPDISRLMETTRSEIGKAKELLQEAERARDQAITFEEKVDGVVDDLGSAQTSLDEARDKIRDLLNNVKDVDNKILQIQDELRPAERTITDMDIQMQNMKPPMDNLRSLINGNDYMANQAQGLAGQAFTEAEARSQEFDILQQQYDKLKQKMKEKQSGQAEGGNAGEPGQRMVALRDNVEGLMQETSFIMNEIQDTEDSLYDGVDELDQKSLTLLGLDQKVKDIRDYILDKVRFHSQCM
ncbi:laminin subunit beta-3 [Polypterus senegalus]|uniref:laminin subunit beta-3 n=1 Tax=Polypterus senegalus TaxID=55291 RepID=UPI001964D4A0|nr:laminin subunit beta-3 [Polypterus senegalus]